MPLNAWWIESVRTYVPLTIATPSTIASAVSAVLSLRANSARRAKRVTRPSCLAAPSLAPRRGHALSEFSARSPRSPKRRGFHGWWKSEEPDRGGHDAPGSAEARGSARARGSRRAAAGGRPGDRWRGSRAAGADDGGDRRGRPGEDQGGGRR